LSASSEPKAVAPSLSRRFSSTVSASTLKVDGARTVVQSSGVLESPEARYVRSNGASLAWQVVGDHPVDVIEIAGMLTHLEAKWEEPGLVRWISDLARFSRVILFDRRGVGLSDHFSGDAAPTLADLVADVVAVLDAAASRRAIVVGISDGGKTAAAFAAAHPERTQALVLYNSIWLRPQWQPADASADEFVAAIEKEWGTGVMAGALGDDVLRAYCARVERRACTPTAAGAMLRTVLAEDLGDVLPRIHVPTIVHHFCEHPGVNVEAARRAANTIPGARLVEMPGYSADAQVRERRALANAIEELVTGAISIRDDDRVLAAVLFTDIVESTGRIADLGDRRWKEILDEHDRFAMRLVNDAGGRIVKNTGDGLLAIFDGAARAIGCARGLALEAVRLGIPIRVGLHVGDCERRGEDIGGMTVNIAARVLALAGRNEILVTSTVRDALVGTDVTFEVHGKRRPGPVGRLSRTLIEGRASPALRCQARGGGRTGVRSDVCTDADAQVIDCECPQCL